MSNTEQIQKMAMTIEAFAKTSEEPFQDPGKFHTKFFDYMYSNANEDGTVFIMALRDVIFAHVDKNRVFDPEDFNGKYDEMASDWMSLIVEVKKLVPKENDILDSMFYPSMLPEFFERTLAYCGFQYLTGGS